MEKFLIIFAVCVLAASLLVYLFFYWKKYRARKKAERQKEEAERQKEEAERQKEETRMWERRELIEACEKGDIDKMIELLEKGVDPNQRIKVWVSKSDDEGYPPSVPPRTLTYPIIQTLLDTTYNPAAKKLLRAYGAKTIEEIREEEAAIEKARYDAEMAEKRRRDAILEAKRKAKKEADMRKVEAILASKGKKA